LSDEIPYICQWKKKTHVRICFRNRYYEFGTFYLFMHL